MLQITQSDQITMTSREIAVLTGSSHDNVLKTIRKLVSEGVVSGNETLYRQEQNGQDYPQFLLTFRDTMVVMTGYNAELRARVIDRWQELEAQQTPKVPRTYAEALLEAGRLAMEVEQQAQRLALAAPKVEFVDKYVASTGNLGFRQVAKLLKVKEPELRDFLIGRRIMYRLAGVLTPYAEHIEAGRFTTKVGVADHGDTSHAYSQTKFTPKGVEWLAGELAKHQARLAVAANDNGGAE